jgi:hypothetical protein
MTRNDRDWLDSTLVWGQVNVNEQDPATFDTGWWSEYWATCGLQGITLNVGGPMAYYPTQVPLHARSPFLGDRDLLGETVHAAKRLGMRVMGRLDPTFTTAAVRRAHPDWCLTAEDGSPHTWDSFVAAFTGRPAPATGNEPTTFLACSASPYFEEFVLAITTEVLERYELDGIWTNGWPFGPGTPTTVCRCPHCDAAWERAHPDQARPRLPDPADPAWRAMLTYESARVEDRQQRFREHVHKVRPEAIFVSSGATRPETTVRWGQMSQRSDALGIDAQGRCEFITAPARRPPLWSVGLQGELSRAVAQGKPVLRFVGTYMSDAPVLRQGARSPIETRLQMAQSLAHGERPKWHTLGGTSHDRRWMPGVREFDTWMSARSDLLTHLTALSDVGVVWSPRSVNLWSWRGQVGPSHRDALVGWYGALMEARIPFEFVHEDFLRDLERFRVLVLPTGLCLADDAVETIESFAARGGAVVASCGALAEDEWGDARPAGRLLALLGIESTEELIGPLTHSCIEVDDHSPEFQGLGDTDIIGGGEWIRPFSGLADTEPTVTGSWIPEYPVVPTQDIVLPPARHDMPLFSRTIGPGGAPSLCVATDLDAAYGRHENDDHGRVLINIVRAALGAEPCSVEVRGPGLVDVRPWRKDRRRLVFLVNLDNARTNGSPVRELRPLPPLEVVVRLASDDVAERVSLDRGDSNCSWSQSGRDVTVSLPVVEDFELLVIELR